MRRKLRSALIRESNTASGKLLLELQEIKNDSVVNIRQFVAYDAERKQNIYRTLAKWSDSSVDR